MAQRTKLDFGQGGFLVGFIGGFLGPRKKPTGFSGYVPGSLNPATHPSNVSTAKGTISTKNCNPVTQIPRKKTTCRHVVGPLSSTRNYRECVYIYQCQQPFQVAKYKDQTFGLFLKVLTKISTFKTQTDIRRAWAEMCNCASYPL